MEDKTKDTVDTSILNQIKSIIKSPKGKEEFEVPGTKNARVEVLNIDAENYNMNHPKRGQAIIFNNVNFEAHLRVNVRNGSDVDTQNLEDVLQKLGFKVQVHHDPKYRDIKNVLEEAADADHTDKDCIFVAVLSHGEEGILYSSDNHYKPDVLWSNFTADRCPSLAGKPKIFLMQACQGDKLDDGVDAKIITETDAGDSNTFKIPSRADFLFAYSTIPGYFSWRNTKQGTWYVQALQQVLMEDGFKLDLLTLLTKVARKVAFDFQSNVPRDVNWHEKKQIPCFTSMLTRNLIFTTKQTE